MHILNQGDDLDAADRLESIVMNGGQKVEVALLGNRFEDNPDSHNKKQNDRLAVMEMHGASDAQCIELMEKLVVKRETTSYDRWGRPTITLLKYNPKTQHVEVRSGGDSPAFMILDDGSHVKALELTPTFAYSEFSYSENLPLIAKDMAVLHGMDPQTLKVDLLVASDGILEAIIPDTIRETARSKEYDEKLVEELYVTAKMMHGKSLSEIMANLAVGWGSTDNISLVLLPNVLAHTEGEPLIACVCDTPGEGRGAQILIKVFQQECLNALGFSASAATTPPKPPLRG